MLFVTAVVFAVLKLSGAVDWSWIIILIPTVLYAIVYWFSMGICELHPLYGGISYIETSVITVVLIIIRLFGLEGLSWFECFGPLIAYLLLLVILLIRKAIINASDEDWL